MGKALQIFDILLHGETIGFRNTYGNEYETTEQAVNGWATCSGATPIGLEAVEVYRREKS